MKSDRHGRDTGGGLEIWGGGREWRFGHGIFVTGYGKVKDNRSVRRIDNKEGERRKSGEI